VLKIGWEKSRRESSGVSRIQREKNGGFVKNSLFGASSKKRGIGVAPIPRWSG
jgi:hypothetical protein